MVTDALKEERLIMITGLEWMSMRDELRNNFEFVKRGPKNLDVDYFRRVGHRDSSMTATDGKPSTAPS